MSHESGELNEVEITRRTYDKIAEDYVRNLKDPYLGGSAAYHEMAVDSFVALGMTSVISWRES